MELLTERFEKSDTTLEDSSSNYSHTASEQSDQDTSDEEDDTIGFSSIETNYNTSVQNLLISVENKVKLIQNLTKKDTEEIALRYITGFAINHILVKKIKCNICLINLIKPSDEAEKIDPPNMGILSAYKELRNDDVLNSELLTKYKCELSSKDITFCNPTDQFFEVVYYNMQIYNISKQHILHIKNVKKHIVDLCIKYTNLKFNNYFDGNNECASHKLDILEYIIRILLRRNCAWMRYEIKKNTRQYTHIKKYKN